jgi:hypothetical protein
MVEINFLDNSEVGVHTVDVVVKLAANHATETTRQISVNVIHECASATISTVDVPR